MASHLQTPRGTTAKNNSGNSTKTASQEAGDIAKGIHIIDHEVYASLPFHDFQRSDTHLRNPNRPTNPSFHAGFPHPNKYLLRKAIDFFKDGEPTTEVDDFEAVVVPTSSAKIGKPRGRGRILAGIGRPIAISMRYKLSRDPETPTKPTGHHFVVASSGEEKKYTGELKTPAQPKTQEIPAKRKRKLPVSSPSKRCKLTCIDVFQGYEWSDGDDGDATEELDLVDSGIQSSMGNIKRFNALVDDEDVAEHQAKRAKM